MLNWRSGKGSCERLNVVVVGGVEEGRPQVGMKSN